MSSLFIPEHDGQCGKPLEEAHNKKLRPTRIRENIMLYRLTIKANANINGVRLEKGMSVEVASQTSNVWGDMKGKELVRNAFMVKYGVDLKKACAIDSVHLDVQGIN